MVRILISSSIWNTIISLSQINALFFFGLEPSRIIEIGSIGLNPTSVSLLGLS